MPSRVNAIAPPQDMPDGKWRMVAPAGRLLQRVASTASTVTSAGRRTARPLAPERMVRDGASTPVAIVARTMAEHHIGSALVTKDGKLVGIFTVTDACRALARILEGSCEEENLVA